MPKKKHMTVEEVEAKVQAIDDNKRDSESAHGDEDDLHQDVLKAIADGAPHAKELAAAALKTKDIEFSRWYA